MNYYPTSIRNLIRQIAKLPGIGEKTLARLLGFDRTAWPPLEEETPAVLVLVRPATESRPLKPLPAAFVQAVAAHRTHVCIRTDQDVERAVEAVDLADAALRR